MKRWQYFSFGSSSELSVVIVWFLSVSLSALRSRSGRSIINGNWAIDRPGKYEGGGTMFTYRRPNEIRSTAGESFLAEGPTNEILDVYVSNLFRQFYSYWQVWHEKVKFTLSHLRFHRWSSSSRILVFTTSTSSPLRRQLALSKKVSETDMHVIWHALERIPPPTPTLNRTHS